jgi:hypothetical protein
MVLYQRALKDRKTLNDFYRSFIDWDITERYKRHSDDVTEGEWILPIGIRHWIERSDFHPRGEWRVYPIFEGHRLYGFVGTETIYDYEEHGYLVALDEPETFNYWIVLDDAGKVEFWQYKIGPQQTDDESWYYPWLHNIGRTRFISSAAT